MPKYIIERDTPLAGSLDFDQLRALSRKSREVICTLGTDIQWIHSYVAGDKVYCIYIASNKDILKKHALLAGFPASIITEIANTIDPGWAE